MSKKGTPGLRQALRAVNQLGQQMTAESNADYSVALSASSAGQKNLMRQTRVLTRDLLVGQQKQTAALSKLAKTARQQKGVVNQNQQNTVNRYGSAMAGSAAAQYNVADSIAAGTGRVVSGQAKAGQKMSNVAQTVAGMAQAGVKAQAGAAKYALAQAMQQRAILDNQTLAQLTGQIYSQAMEYQTQVALMEKEAKLAEEQAEGSEKSEARRLMGEGSTIAVAAAEAARAHWAGTDPTTGEPYADPEKARLNITEAATQWANENGYSGDPGAIAMYTATLRNITANHQTADVAYGNALDNLFANSPGYNKWGSHVKKAGMTNVQIAAQQAYADYVPPVDDGGAMTWGNDSNEWVWRSGADGDMGEFGPDIWHDGAMDWGNLMQWWSLPVTGPIQLAQSIFG